MVRTNPAYQVAYAEHTRCRDTYHYLNFEAMGDPTPEKVRAKDRAYMDYMNAMRRAESTPQTIEVK